MKTDQHDRPIDSFLGASVEILPPLSDAPGGNVFRVKTGDGKTYYAYEYPHPSVAASVVVHDLSKQAFLLVKRSTDPFNGYFVFPGGFIDVGKEEIEDAAVRELYEEAGVKLQRSDLQLIDVRSHPQRDPRDHVFDVAFYAEGRNIQARVGEEVSAFRWFTPSELDHMQLAFDHDLLWERVKSRFLSEKRWDAT